jgi:hypothetical protein
VLALLVALLSVATVAGPVFRDLLTTKDSDLAVGSFQGFNDDGEAMFVVSNSGNRPGTVADAYVLVAPLDKPNESIYFTGFPRGKLSSEESFFVDGGKSKLVRFRARPRPQEPKLEWEGQNIQRFQCALDFPGCVEDRQRLRLSLTPLQPGPPGGSTGPKNQNPKIFRKKNCKRFLCFFAGQKISQT